MITSILMAILATIIGVFVLAVIVVVILAIVAIAIEYPAGFFGISALIVVGWAFGSEILKALGWL